jgi:hypothetical protein
MGFRIANALLSGALALLGVGVVAYIVYAFDFLPHFLASRDLVVGTIAYSLGNAVQAYMRAPPV